MTLPGVAARVLLFAPYTGLLEHARLEFSVVSGLISTGARVDVLRCRGVLPTPCTTMDGTLGVDREPSRRLAGATCRFCVESGNALVTASGADELFLEDLVTKEDLEACHTIALRVGINNWQDLVVDGVDVGKHAAYVSLIRAKASSPADLGRAWNRYAVDLEASLIVLKATKALLAKRTYDVAVTFGGLYGPERVFHRVTSSAQVPLVVLEGSVLNQERHSVVHAFSSDRKYFHTVFDSDWSQHRSTPLDGETARRAQVHHEALLDSSSPLVYSTDRNLHLDSRAIRGVLGIPSDALVLLFLVSSPDEEVSRQYTSGQDPEPEMDSVRLQSSIVDKLVRFAALHPHIHIVIRLHPRLFGDHRTAESSPALVYYGDLARDAPANVHINSPDQGLSLYDLALITDAGVVHQSTAGLELLALGLPVVAAGSWLMAFPPDLATYAQDDSDKSFFEVLLAALQSPGDFVRVRSAYRWWGFISNFNRMLVVHDPLLRPEEGDVAARALASSRRGAQPTAVRLVRRYTPRAVRRSVSMKLRMRRIPQIVAEVSATNAITAGTKGFHDAVFWAVADGVNVVSGRQPLPPAEEAQLLKAGLLRVASQLGVDSSMPGKLGAFVETIRRGSEGQS